VPSRRITDSRSTLARIAACLLAVIALDAGLHLGNQKWSTQPALLLQRAENAFETGDVAEAQELLERAVSADPMNALTLYNLGIVYFERELFAEAAETLERARIVTPDDPGVLFALGLAYANLGQYAETRQALEQFLARQPDGESADSARRLLNRLP
jgi:tetratricopeptide (TPR) repeat protein